MASSLVDDPIGNSDDDSVVNLSYTSSCSSFSSFPSSSYDPFVVHSTHSTPFPSDDAAVPPTSTAAILPSHEPPQLTLTPSNEPPPNQPNQSELTSSSLQRMEASLSSMATLLEATSAKPTTPTPAPAPTPLEPHHSHLPFLPIDPATSTPAPPNPTPPSNTPAVIPNQVVPHPDPSNLTSPPAPLPPNPGILRDRKHIQSSNQALIKIPRRRKNQSAAGPHPGDVQSAAEAALVTTVENDLDTLAATLVTTTVLLPKAFF